MKKVVFLSIAIFLVLEGVSFASSGLEGAAGDMLKNVGRGILGGVLAAVLGWVKNGYKSGEKFEIKWAIPTVIVGAIVGAVGALKGYSIEQASDWIVSTGIIVIADLLWKAIWRNGGPALSDAISTIKTGGGAGNPPSPGQ